MIVLFALVACGLGPALPRSHRREDTYKRGQLRAKIMKFNVPESSTYNTNRDAEAKDGIEVQLEEGMVFIIKRAGGANRKFAEALSRRKRPFARLIDRDQMEYGDLVSKVMIPAYLDAVIIGWTGAVFEGIEFNRQNATEFFTAYPDAFEDLMAESTNKANFALAHWEESAERLGN